VKTPIEDLITQARNSSDALRHAPFRIDRETFADGVDALADALAVQAARITELEAEQPPCDGGCSYGDGPEETCSLHGRKVSEVWEIASSVGAERDGYAAVIEEIRAAITTDEEISGAADCASGAPERLRALTHRSLNRIERILDSVDTSTAVQAIRDRAFEEAAVLAESRAGGQPINSDDRLDWGEWRALRQFAAAIRSQQGGKTNGN